MGTGAAPVRGACCAVRSPRDFGRAETGSLTVYSLFMFVLMLMIGGIAVDVMRYENTRTIAQNCMDRGSLAAADLDQTLSARLVATDYLKKCGLSEDAFVVDVAEEMIGDTLTGREVTATVNLNVDTMFMQMMGIEELPIAAASTAAESVNDIEIAMVLDVSGSMGQNSKLENMKTAAKDFVDIVFAQTEQDRLSLSLVPYSTQVNAGPALLGALRSTADHDYSHCVDFSADDYLTTTISPIHDTLNQAGHFDPWTGADRGARPRSFVCRTDAPFAVTPWSQDVVALRDQIDALTANGNTSIDIAMKWGAALLDPAMQPALLSMALGTSPAVDPAFIGRPNLFGAPNTLKFIVVMTDGINTTQYALKDGFKRGKSKTWYDPDTGRYSVRATEAGDADGDGKREEKYFWPRPYGAEVRAWDDDRYDRKDDNDGLPLGPWDRVNRDDDAFELTWPQLWAQMTLSHRAWSHHYARYGVADDYWSNFYAPFTAVDADEKDDRLSDICTAAKTAGITVFSVGFEVTDDSADIMRACASSPSHFYRVDGLDIATAFASIANKINQLKLTQ